MGWEGVGWRVWTEKVGPEKKKGEKGCRGVGYGVAGWCVGALDFRLDAEGGWLKDSSQGVMWRAGGFVFPQGSEVCASVLFPPPVSFFDHPFHPFHYLTSFSFPFSPSPPPPLPPLSAMDDKDKKAEEAKAQAKVGEGEGVEGEGRVCGTAR